MIRKSHLVFVVFFVLAALVLSACTQVGGDKEGILKAHDFTTETVFMDTSIDGDLLFIEIDKWQKVGTAAINTATIDPVAKPEIIVKESSNRKLYSHSPRIFTDLAPASILESTTIVPVEKSITECLGPCVIELYSKIKNRISVEVTIKNNNNFDVKYNLRTRINKGADKNEPNSVNNCTVKSRPASVLITPTPKPPIEIKGAIEYIGDVDCFTTSAQILNVTLETDANNSTGAIATIYEKGTNNIIGKINLNPGVDSKTINTSSKAITVHVSADHKAGPAKHSSYTLTLK